MDSSLDLRSVTPAELVKTYINNAADLLDAGDRLLPGERIELFFALAANRPEVAFPAFLTILRDIADPNYRALALRGLGQIVHPETLQEIQACKTESAQELVQMLASELLGNGSYSNDLTRWAAADAITNLQYPASILRGAAFGGLMESPDRIQRELVGRWLGHKDKVKRFDSQNQITVEYERYLDFWTFGPFDRLFLESNLASADVIQLLEHLQFLGLIQALKENDNNSEVVKHSYEMFQHYCRVYLSSGNRLLGENLTRFISTEALESSAGNISVVVKRLAKIINSNYVNKSPAVITTQTFNELKQLRNEVMGWIESIERDQAWINQYVSMAALSNELAGSFNYNRSLIQEQFIQEIDSQTKTLEKCMVMLASYSQGLEQCLKSFADLLSDFRECSGSSSSAYDFKRLSALPEVTELCYPAMKNTMSRFPDHSAINQVVEQGIQQDLLVMKNTKMQDLKLNQWYPATRDLIESIIQIHSQLQQDSASILAHQEKYQNIYRIANAGFFPMPKFGDEEELFQDNPIGKLVRRLVFFFYPPYVAVQISDLRSYDFAVSLFLLIFLALQSLCLSYFITAIGWFAPLTATHVFILAVAFLTTGVIARSVARNAENKVFAIKSAEEYFKIRLKLAYERIDGIIKKKGKLYQEFLGIINALRTS